MTATLYFEIYSLLLCQFSVLRFFLCSFTAVSELFSFLPCIQNDNDKRNNRESQCLLATRGIVMTKTSGILQLLESKPLHSLRIGRKMPAKGLAQVQGQKAHFFRIWGETVNCIKGGVKCVKYVLGI